MSAESNTEEPDTDEPPPSSHSLIRIWLLIGIVVGVWALSWFGLSILHSDLEKRGQFGDTFGAVNALFSGLAFAILIHTMWLQKEELELQRKELKMTRRELKRSATAQEESKKATTKSIEMAAWVQATAVWTDKDFIEGRRVMLTRVQYLGTAFAWSSRQKEIAMDVCRRMDEFAYLALFLDQKRVLEVWDDPLGKTWAVLQPVVEEERKNVKWESKWSRFEELGSAALEKLIREGRDPRPSPSPSS
jgi:hypothetical protein